MHSEIPPRSSLSLPMSMHRILPQQQQTAIDNGANHETHPNRFESTSEQLKSATSILDSVTNNLLTCPSDFYIIATQPGVHVLDYSASKSAPRLRDRVLKKDNAIKSSFMVSEVVGEFDVSYLQSTLESKCGAKTVKVDGACTSLNLS